MGNRLYVGNLSFNANTDTVREAFSAFGEITDVHVVSDRETGQSRRGRRASEPRRRRRRRRRRWWWWWSRRWRQPLVISVRP
jgi:hypothetical protein